MAEEKWEPFSSENLAAYKKSLEGLTPKQLYDRLHEGMKGVDVYYFGEVMPDDVLQADEEWRLAVGGEYVEQRPAWWHKQQAAQQAEQARNGAFAASNGHTAASGSVLPGGAAAPSHESVTTPELVTVAPLSASHAVSALADSAESADASRPVPVPQAA